MSTRIVGLERRLQPIGKLRLGNQIVTKGGKKRPHVLEKIRMTSPNAFLLHEAAKLYGGTVARWEDAPAGPTQWELYVEAEEIPIIIPPIESLSQCYECWSAKGCLRRCDNATITHALDLAEVGTACQCPSDPQERLALAADGHACKLTTRISCMLPDVPGFGVWTIETHSYYASLWTAGMVEMLEAMAKQGRVIEATLKIERQARKTAQGMRHFAIPVIQPQGMTPRQLFAQEMQRALAPLETQKLLPDETQKSLPEHISDLYGDPPPQGHLEGESPLVAQIDAILVAQGLDAAARAAWWVKMDAKYPGRSPDTLRKLSDDLREAAAKRGTTLTPVHVDSITGEVIGDSTPPQPDLWKEEESETL